MEGSFGKIIQRARIPVTVIVVIGVTAMAILKLLASSSGAAQPSSPPGGSSVAAQNFFASMYDSKGDIPLNIPVPDDISVLIRGNAGTCLWKNVSEVLYRRSDNISFRQNNLDEIVDLHGPYSVEVSIIKKK